MSGWKRLASPAFLAALALLAASGIGLRAAAKAMGAHLVKLRIDPPDGLAFHTLPREANGWQYVPSPADQPLSAEVLEELGTSNYLSRVYSKKFGEREVFVEVHCAYYTGMVDTVPHVPERCFVGGGMSIVSAPEEVRVPLDMDRYVTDQRADPAVFGGVVRTGFAGLKQVRMPVGIENLRMMVTRFRDAASNRETYAGYFFVANGGTAPSADDVRLLAFKLKDDYAYYAKVQFTSAYVTSAEDLAELAADFLDGMFPEIMRRTPDWVEVVEGRYPADNPRRERAAGGASV
ncbi:MAG: exosortase-associated EpsI family protein [Phycisphaerales bacterium]